MPAKRVHTFLINVRHLDIKHCNPHSTVRIMAIPWVVTPLGVAILHAADFAAALAHDHTHMWLPHILAESDHDDMPWDA